MRVKSKYKVARRLGASVFEKTQTQKFALRQEQKKGGQRRGRGLSGYGKQLIEKQKVRFTYNLSEKQFANYIKKAIEKGGTNPAEYLFNLLERRLDNVVLRAGFAPTRFASRQYTSHGHFMVNGRRVTVPSYELREGDVITVREGSQQKAIFADVETTVSEQVTPSWLNVNAGKKEITIKGQPVYVAKDLPFDLEQVLQFYKR